MPSFHRHENFPNPANNLPFVESLCHKILDKTLYDKGDTFSSFFYFFNISEIIRLVGSVSCHFVSSTPHNWKLESAAKDKSQSSVVYTRNVSPRMFPEYTCKMSPGTYYICHKNVLKIWSFSVVTIQLRLQRLIKCRHMEYFELTKVFIRHSKTSQTWLSMLSYNLKSKQSFFDSNECVD